MKKNKKINSTNVKALKVKKVNLAGFDKYKSSIKLDDKKKLINSLVEMFMNGDHDAFMELIELYIDHVGKREVSRKTHIPERTIYNFIDKKHKTSSENLFKLMAFINQDAKRTRL